MTIKEFFSFKINKFFWLNIIGMVVAVIGLAFGVMKWLDIYTRHGETVMVPDVAGMTIEDAVKLCHDHKLECIVSDSTYVKKQPAGIILDVKPAIGQKVKEGRTIYLTINTLSVPLRAVPDVAGNSSLRQAQAKVLASGFKLDEEELMNGERDWVYGVKYKGQELSAGDEIPLGATLTLMVGNGIDPASVDSLATDSVEVIVMEPSDTELDDSWF